jgi:beta-galactosidase/beta-glucuronidase
MEETVAQLRHHPSICLWTIFNEGWGQFCGTEAYRKLKSLDDTRFIDTASGWFRGGESDVDSEHVYFKAVKLTYGDKPMILSEFGGYACKIEGHAPAGSYGYRFFSTPAELEAAILRLYEEEILPAIPRGLCAAVYTQLTDVEDEVNGLVTYDRAVVKVDPAPMRDLATRLSEAIRERQE